MFQQIARLDADKFYFEFPIGCLPVSPPGVCMCARACVVPYAILFIFWSFSLPAPNPAGTERWCYTSFLHRKGSDGYSIG